MRVLFLLLVLLCPYSASAQLPIDHKPIPVSLIPYVEDKRQRPGWEERGPQWAKWLAPSVRIGGGSGTICYWDPETKYAYVISCGHLFRRGTLTWEQAQERNETKTIEVFYHNQQKLPQVKKYQAEVLCYRNFSESVWDVSLMRFKTDWEMAWYAPIAPKNYTLEAGEMYHSCGCDGRSEVAHYLVEYIEERKKGSVTEIVTHKNNPRGGRSGGGVMTDDGQLIFICSRGNSQAYWTSLQQIHKMLEVEKEWTWLLEVGYNIYRKIPVVDTENPTQMFPEDYIPIPF